MKEKTCKSVRLSYGIIFGVFTVVVGALFIWQVLTLYYTGTAAGFKGKPFTYERVTDALSKIALFFWLWIAGIVVGFVLWEVFPVKEKARKISPDLQTARLNKRMPSSAPINQDNSFHTYLYMEADYNAVISSRKVIFALKCAAWAMFAIACVYGILYLCIPSNFPAQNVTGEMLNFAKHVFPCVFAGLIVVCGAGIYEKYTVKSLLPKVQRVTKGQKPRTNLTVREKIEGVFENKWVVLGIRIALGVIAVALIIWGALNGSARTIFIKAINICTECIGLG